MHLEFFGKALIPGVKPVEKLSHPVGTGDCGQKMCFAKTGVL